MSIHHASLRCPRCRGGVLQPHAFEEQELALCAGCGGLWCAAGRWDEAALGPRPPVPGAEDGVYFLETAGHACPECRQAMTAVRIPEMEALTIDVCGACGGVWFDHREWQHLGAVRQWREQRARVERATTWGDWFFQFFLRLPVEFNIAPRRVPIVTLTIVVICCLLQIIQQFVMGPEEMITRYGAQASTVFTAWGLFTLISHQFVHGGWLHLLGNMYLLYVLGDNVEDVLGRAGYALFFLAGGVVAAGTELAVAAALGNDVPLVGASGSIAGIIAAYLLLFRRARLTFMFIFWQFKPPAVVWIGVWLLMQVAAAFLDPSGAMTGVAWWAHLGGFAFGFLVILPLHRWLVSRHHLLYLLHHQRIRR